MKFSVALWTPPRRVCKFGIGQWVWNHIDYGNFWCKILEEAGIRESTESARTGGEPGSPVAASRKLFPEARGDSIASCILAADRHGKAPPAPTERDHGGPLLDPVLQQSPFSQTKKGTV